MLRFPKSSSIFTSRESAFLLRLCGIIGFLVLAGDPAVLRTQEGEVNQTPLEQNKPVQEESGTSIKPTDQLKLEFKNTMLSRELALAFSHPGVERELELVAYQKEQLRDLFYSYQKSMSELAPRFARMKQEDRGKIFEQLMEKVDKELEQILLPPQRKRLRQISFQSLAPTNNQELAPFVSVLANSKYRQQLSISAETGERLQAKHREEYDKFAAKVAELRQAAIQRVLDTLTPAERESLEAGLGTSFDFGGYQLGRGGVFQMADDK